MSPEEQQTFAVLKLGRDRKLAHAVLFAHRHPDETPPFHAEIIDLWHSTDPAALVMAFREGGKSTIAEETFIIAAGYKLFNNAIIVAATERRACERLRAIKWEIETNELVQTVFGELRGHVWNEAEIILANGVRIIAVGRGQSLRGTKHLHYRPDFCFCDDIEEDEHVKDERSREETSSWFMKVLLPALDKKARIRVNATPLHAEALPHFIENRLKWPTRRYPIEYIDEQGERRATWAARYPLSWIDKKKSQYDSAGKVQDYMREYMCVAEDASRKTFTREMMRIVPRVRTWHPTYAFFDPARTVKVTSATTGWGVWSWIGNRLIIWDGGGEFYRPDEVVSKIFDVDEEYRPVAIGAEIDGLHEFLEQPLRQEMLRRGYILPLRPMKAPKGKLSFIESLQPYFRAGEITFAKPCYDIEAQFMNFPGGRIDAPNAIAYALLMRPGQVVYDTFGTDNVVERATVTPRSPCWLCLNAKYGYVTGVLAQYRNGTLWIVADFVREGEPTSCVGDIIKEAHLETDNEIRCLAAPEHWSGYNHLGLRGAVAKIPAELRRGASPEMGRNTLRELLSRRASDIAGVQVSQRARWTLNALAAGYCFSIGKQGMLEAEPQAGVYRCLIEPVEAFTGILSQGIMADSRPNMQRTKSGQLYISALPGQAGVVDAKDTFLDPGAVTSANVLSARRLH